MDTVFNLFPSVKYKYLQINRGTVRGNRITSSVEHEGIFKLRSGMVQGEREIANSDATLHVRPEDYDSPDELVGNGILYEGVTYRIAGVTEGRNFATNKVEHYRLTLEKETFFNAEDF